LRTSCTKSSTLRFDSFPGPKLNAESYNCRSNGRSDGFASTAASHKYPLRGSSTCCHGLVDILLRTGIDCPICRARTQSGKILSRAQSAPPMTLPARADAIRTGWLEKKDRLHEAMAISAAALLEL